MAARTTTSQPINAPGAAPHHRPSAHLVGIGGAGMKALAELLTSLGWRVTGSDAKESAALDEMRRRGWRVFGGHDDAYLPRAVDLLVHSPAVGPENAERAEAARRGVPQATLSEMFGRLMTDRAGVAVTGTHGKSTTTAMVAGILRAAGREPSAAFGAELCGSGRSGWGGAGNLLVVEGCEYRRSFLSLRPTHALVLNVEADHFDCYADESAVRAAFAEFAALLPEWGTLVVRSDAASVVAEAAARIVTFSGDLVSDDAAADYRAADLRPVQGGTRFRLFRRGEYLAEMTLRVPGAHNVLNALAAAALCHELGVSAGELRDGLWDFRGVRRRFEAVGSWRGRQLVDDYAHHPTAVRAVLETARREYPGRRLWCAFQPHQVSRTRALMSEFARSLAQADAAFVLPVFAARESGPAASGNRAADDASIELTAAVVAAGGTARFLPSLDLLPDAVDHETRPGDVIVTMGAGDIDQVHHEFSRRLRRRHAAG